MSARDGLFVSETSEPRRLLHAGDQCGPCRTVWPTMADQLPTIRFMSIRKSAYDGLHEPQPGLPIRHCDNAEERQTLAPYLTR
jgi:hypothetical protein